MKNYDEAIEWYFRAIGKDKTYKAPHSSLTDIFKTLKYDEEKVEELMRAHPVQPDYFYYYTGLSYYDKKDYDLSIKYYNKALESPGELSKELFKVYNSMGITYDDKK